MNNKLNLESLIQGIEAFISKNRCSLSNEDLVLLNDCLSFLKSSKQTKKKLTFEDVEKICTFLLKAFSTAANIIDLLR
jgi:hypothetical protein